MENKMYKITDKQAKALTKVKKYGDHNFHPVQDINGDWFVGEWEYTHIILHFGFEPIEAEFVPEPYDIP